MYTENEVIALNVEPKPLEVDNRTQDSTERNPRVFCASREGWKRLQAPT